MNAYTVLIVEDDAAIRQLYRLKLEFAGLKVLTAQDGVEGLRLAENHIPALILLDLRMPVMDGEEMLEKLRAEDWGASIRIVILTNISRDEAPLRLRYLNVDRYIVKAHHTPQQLLDIVKEILG